MLIHIYILLFILLSCVTTLLSPTPGKGSTEGLAVLVRQAQWFCSLPGAKDLFITSELDCLYYLSANNPADHVATGQCLVCSLYLKLIKVCYQHFMPSVLPPMYHGREIMYVREVSNQGTDSHNFFNCVFIFLICSRLTHSTN